MSEAQNSSQSQFTVPHSERADVRGSSPDVSLLPAGPLGFTVNVLSPSLFNEWIGSGERRKRLVITQNMHSVFLRQRDVVFPRIEELADVTIADGFPVWLLTRVWNIRRKTQPGCDLKRMGTTDWLLHPSFADNASKVAVIGASCQSNANAIRRLNLLYPSLGFRGWNGYEDINHLKSEQFASLATFDPDVVLVGLGMPIQEKLLLESWQDLPNATYCVVGGAIDQISGAQSLCPRWLGAAGFEWLYRLLREPRRLYWRYLIEPFLLVKLVLKGEYRRDGFSSDA